MDTRVEGGGGSAGSDAGRVWPAPRVAWYSVGVLALTVMFAELDRGIIQLLVQSIKRDFLLTDTQISYLLGFTFILIYSIIGLPLSLLIDRFNRKVILSVGLAVWSVATVFCGMAQNFWALAFGRMMLGAGESVNAPTGFSLLADLFPKERLPRAIAVMQLGLTCAAGLSLIIGAYVIQSLASVPPIHIPGVGLIRNWQMVFIVVGVPGLLVALLMAKTVPEPARLGTYHKNLSKVPLVDAIKFLANKWPIFLPMFLGLALSSINGQTNTWNAPFFERTYGWGPVTYGHIMGLVSLIVSPIGLFSGVWLVERYARQQRPDAPMRVIVISRLVGIPFAILGPLMPSPWLALGMAVVGNFMVAFGGASQNAALQIVTPNQMRGQVTALYLFMFFVVGAAGPTVVAWITDYVFHNEAALRYSLSITHSVLGPISLVCVLLSYRPWTREVIRLKELELGKPA
ncbi:MAG TPA: MFS transporter [Alphaproteobacteria bacterium]|nr:MFS transporter [Alphaproteobacteria bacterium]